MAKKTVLLKCRRENLTRLKEIATSVELSITSYGSAPESESVTIAVIGNHNCVNLFTAFMIHTGAAWVKKDKKVETPSKV